MPRQIKLQRIAIIRLGRILDMLYRPAELAEEIGVSPSVIYQTYLPAGMPHHRDGRGGIWIRGTDFVAWARQMLSKRSHVSMPDNYAWCVRCRKPVAMTSPVKRRFNRNVDLLQDHCSSCGATINRAIRKTT